MNVELFLENYGYAAVFLGGLLEGETLLVLGGLAAHQGYLHLPFVILAAFLGAFTSDQLFFFLGRKHSRFILARRPSWRARIEKADRLLKRYETPVVLGFCFFYGLRMIIPFTIGLSRIPVRRFFLLNLIGVFTWAVTIGGCAYLFGHLLETLLGNLKRYEYAILIVVTLAGTLTWLIHFYFRRKQARQPPAPDPEKEV